MIALLESCIGAVAIWRLILYRPISVGRATRFLGYHVAINRDQRVVLSVAALLTLFMTLYGMSRGIISPGAFICHICASGFDGHVGYGKPALGFFFSGAGIVGCDILSLGDLVVWRKIRRSPVYSVSALAGFVCRLCSVGMGIRRSGVRVAESSICLI